MARKSIADLDRYENYLQEMINNYQTRIYTGIFETGVIDQPNMQELFRLLEAHQDALIILQQEITIACLSNSLQHGGEEYSIFQANKMLDRMFYNKLRLHDLRNRITEGKENPEVFRYKQQTLSLEELDARIDDILQQHYALKDKVDRAKAKTIVEIEMSDLLPATFMEPEPDDSEDTEPEVIEVTSVE